VDRSTPSATNSTSCVRAPLSGHEMHFLFLQRFRKGALAASFFQVSTLDRQRAASPFNGTVGFAIEGCGGGVANVYRARLKAVRPSTSCWADGRQP